MTMAQNEGRPKRSPLRIGLTSGIFISAAIILAVISTHIGIDQSLFILFLLLIVGVFILFMAVRRNPTNVKEEKDEAETCDPIIEAYNKSKSLDTLMSDFTNWKKGEHSTYTRMHFAEKIIDILRENGEYETALTTLYEVGQLPLKAREHYDYDKYRTACEAELKEAIAAQKRSANKAKKKK